MNKPGSPDPSVNEDRRPLASRDTGWARMLARRAVSLGWTPNAISMASTGFAAFGASALLISSVTDGVPAAICLLLAAVGCQMRLVCNLIDGMVAIEGGRASATGAVWNELPDRVSDMLLFAACGVLAHSLALGWAAASAAVLAAYVREMGHRLTGIVNFQGLMAKPQRMAVITIACVIAAVLQMSGSSSYVLVFQVALAVLLAGALQVSFVRARHVLHELKQMSS